MSFSYADIQGTVRKTTGSTQVVGSLLTSLVGNTRLSASTLGLTVALPPELMNAVGATLGRAWFSPLDQLLAGVLALAGVGLGQAEHLGCRGPVRRDRAGAPDPLDVHRVAPASRARPAPGVEIQRQGPVASDHDRDRGTGTPLSRE